jgi:hypothetical protein
MISGLRANHLELNQRHWPMIMLCGVVCMTYLSRVPKIVFLYAHLKGLPLEAMVSAKVERAAARYLMEQAPWSRPLKGFEQYLTRCASLVG